MVKWGDALSTLLPGTVALFAVAPQFPLLRQKLENLDQIGVGDGFALLIAATLAGGVLQAVTRVFWEKYWLLKRCPVKVDPLKVLSSENIDLYERGVQSSYKWVTFYANFAWATILLLASSFIHSEQPYQQLCTGGTGILSATTLLLLRASHVQWCYFVNYQTKVFGPGRATCRGR